MANETGAQLPQVAVLKQGNPRDAKSQHRVEIALAQLHLRAQRVR